MIPPWLETMRSITGTLEAPGASDNPVILGWAREIGERFPEMRSYVENYTHDSIAWCGLTVAICMARNGIRPPFGSGDTGKFLWVDSWGDWPGSTHIQEPQLGDVMVFSSPHHVTLYEGEDGDHYVCRGGNQSDAVKVSRFAKSGLRLIVRPPSAAAIPVPRGGTVQGTNGMESGKGSWYSQNPPEWVDKGDGKWNASKTEYLGPNNALGVPDEEQGISFYDRSTLGKWFDVTAPNGVTLRLRQTDVGPHPKTGRKIDIAAVAAERFGYSPRNFPTDGIFKWRPAVTQGQQTFRPAGRPAPQPSVNDPEVDALAAAIAKRLQPKVEKTMGTALTAILTLVMGVLPQTGVWGLVIHQILVGFGAVGPAFGEAATATGQDIFATALGAIGSGLLSKFFGLRSKQNDGSNSK